LIPALGGDFIQWLRGFYYVALTGGLSAAAQAMDRNQPAISHHLKSLERELGVTLFDTSKGQRLLTEEGEILLRRAISIFETIKATREELGRLEQDPTGRLTIAATPGVQLFYLPRFVVAFKQRHPRVKFELFSGGRGAILERVRLARADMGIISPLKPPPGLEFEPLFATRPVLIAPAGSPLGRGPSPSLARLAKEPFIAFSGSSSLASELDRLCTVNGVSLQVTQSLNNIGLVKKYVALGLGISIIDDFALEAGDKTSLAVRSLHRLLPPRQYGLIQRQGMYFSPALRSFYALLRGGIDPGRTPDKE
jgi:DNA-binding transcriptional LysR family regulator